MRHWQCSRSDAAFQKFETESEDQHRRFSVSRFGDGDWMSWCNGKKDQRFSDGAHPMLHRSRKTLLENAIVKRRETEHRRQLLWDSTAKYFNTLQSQNERIASWNSPDVLQKSSDALARARLVDAKRTELLRDYGPHEHMVRREERRFIEEVNSDHLFQGVKDMRKERQLMQDRRREEQEQQARQLMQSHYQINHPKEQQQLLFQRPRRMVAESREMPLADSSPPPEDEADSSRGADVLLQKAMHDESHVLQTNVLQNVKELRQQQLLKWKDSILNFIEESKECRKLEDILKREIFLMEEKQSSLDRIQWKRGKMEKSRNEVYLSFYTIRQHRLKIKAKSQALQAHLEEDLSLIKELQPVVGAYPKAAHSLQALQNQIRDQKNDEVMRQQGVGLLFSEEAEKMWLQQEQQWQEDQLQRSLCFQRLIASVKDTMQAAIQGAKMRLESCQRQIQTVEESIDKLSSDLKQEEETAERLPSSDLVLQDLELCNEQDGSKPLSDQHPHLSGPDADLELAARLTSACKLAEASKFEVADFRRRRVQWYD